jgi:hypothetical protein
MVLESVFITAAIAQIILSAIKHGLLLNGIDCGSHLWKGALLRSCEVFYALSKCCILLKINIRDFMHFEIILQLCYWIFKGY